MNAAPPVRSDRARPRPVETPDDAPFWEGVREGELRLPFCPSCQRFDYPPGPSCTTCGSTTLRWRTVAHDPVRGTLVSFTICYRSFLDFADQVPFIVAVVELTDAPEVRMVGNLLGVEPDPALIELGASLRLEWVAYAEGVVLPQWRLAAVPDGARS